MVSLSVDQGQEAASIEVQVVMVGVCVQAAVRESQRGREGGKTAGWKASEEEAAVTGPAAMPENHSHYKRDIKLLSSTYGELGTVQNPLYSLTGFFLTTTP